MADQTFEMIAREQIQRLPDDVRRQIANYAIDPASAAEAPRLARGVAKRQTHLKLLPELRAILDCLRIAAQIKGLAAATGTGTTAAFSVVLALGLRTLLLSDHSLTCKASEVETDRIKESLRLS